MTQYYFQDFRKKVPQLHIKVNVSSDGNFRRVSTYEKVDGQQRTRGGIIDFMMNKFPIGDKEKFPKSLYNGIDLSGKYFKDLKSIVPDLYLKFLEYITMFMVWKPNR